MTPIDNIQTIITESRKPILLDTPIDSLTKNGSAPVILVPTGFSVENVEKFLPAPLRKRSAVTLLDTASFNAYVKKHGVPDETVIYANTNFEEQSASLLCVLDDTGPGKNETSWREHTATFNPTKTVEWKRWDKSDGVFMSQLEFAIFIEENMPDIASNIEGMPSGTEMLQMATQFEATAEKSFKKKLDLQGNGVTMEFVDAADNQTATRMKMFSKFSLGIKVFIGGAPYQLDARLRYKQTGDKLSFKYELIRSDRVFESAINDEIAKVSEETGFLILTGSPRK